MPVAFQRVVRETARRLRPRSPLRVRPATRARMGDRHELQDHSGADRTARSHERDIGDLAPARAQIRQLRRRVRPVLIAPRSPQPQMGTNVLIAWNCSTEQARTTAFALPILKRASRVVVLTVEGGAAVPGPTGQQLCRYLQLNGVPAKPLTVGLDGPVTGEAVLSHANSWCCGPRLNRAPNPSRFGERIFCVAPPSTLATPRLPGPLSKSRA